MEVSRGANLVGMSMLPPDVCPLSLLIRNIYIYITNIFLRENLVLYITSEKQSLNASLSPFFILFFVVFIFYFYFLI